MSVYSAESVLAFNSAEFERYSSVARDRTFVIAFLSSPPSE